MDYFPGWLTGLSPLGETEKQSQGEEGAPDYWEYTLNTHWLGGNLFQSHPLKLSKGLSKESLPCSLYSHTSPEELPSVD